MKRSERFPSKYQQAADLPEEGITLVIDRVVKEMVGQGADAKKKPVLYFLDGKPLVLNSTNDRTLTELFGEDDRDWHGERITLYATTTSFGNQTVACIRMRAPVDDDEEDESPPKKAAGNTFKATGPSGLKPKKPVPAKAADFPEEDGDPGFQPDEGRDYEEATE